MVWWWYCNVGVCLSHFLRSVFFFFFPPAMLPACDIIYMCPIRPMRAGIRSWHMAQSGGTKNEKYSVYFPHWEVKCICCMLLILREKTKKKKDTTNKGLNIFYHLQCLAYCRICFAATTISFFIIFCHHWGSEQGCKAIHLSLRYKLRSHFRFSCPLVDTSAAPSPTPTSGPKLLSTATFGLRKWLIPHGCLCGWGPECTSVPRASQEDFCENWFYSFAVAPHMKPLIC